jgi:branched-chain amino acid transport system substrate-binding protein
MKRKKIVIVFIFLAVLAGIFFWFNRTRSGTIKIVSSVPLQGMNIGQGMYYGADMAFSEIGYKIGRFDIQFILKDDSDAKGVWQANLEKQNAEEAVADPDVMVYFGPYDSGAAKISIPITNLAGLVQVGPSNTWPGLTQPGYAPGEPGIFYPSGKRTYFRTCLTDALKIPAGAIWAKKMGVKKVYIINNPDIYSSDVSMIFEKKAKELGLSVIARNLITEDILTINTVINDIKKNHADLIYYGGSTSESIILFIKELRAQGVTTQIMGSDGIFEKSFITAVGKDAEGILITSNTLPVSSMTGDGKDFVDKYKAKYGVEPDIYGVYSYEAAKIVISAIRRAGIKDRKIILDEISKTYIRGIFGMWHFDENGDTTVVPMLSGNIVKNGNFEFVELISQKTPYEFY